MSGTVLHVGVACVRVTLMCFTNVYPCFFRTVGRICFMKNNYDLKLMKKTINKILCVCSFVKVDVCSCFKRIILLELALRIGT